MGKRNVENIAALRDAVDPNEFAVFIRYVADERRSWHIIYKVLRTTDLGQSYMRRAKLSRPSLSFDGDFDVKELVNTVEAAALFDSLLDDPEYGPDMPEAKRWIWRRHWKYPPGNSPLYKFMVEIAQLREQRQGDSVEKLKRIATVRKLIEREWEFERYGQWRDKIKLQEVNILAAADLHLNRSNKRRARTSAPKADLQS
jgi:hypothetical protein